MKLITEEWLDRAKEDLDVAAEIIAREHLTNMVAFHSQQAVEKTLKGIVEEFEIGIHNSTGCCPNPFERSLKRFCSSILAKWKISALNCLSPAGEFSKRLERALD